MQIEYGAEVVDKSGKVLGTINYIIRDTWTGEIRKLMIRKKLPDKDLMFSPQDVLEATKSKIKVNISINEQGENE
jgi:sporulation protein YlmC with PRC-barrel domain